MGIYWYVHYLTSNCVISQVTTYIRGRRSDPGSLQVTETLMQHSLHTCDNINNNIVNTDVIVLWINHSDVAILLISMSIRRGFMY